MADLKGQTLVIPPVQRQVSTWKATRHPHPLHEHLKTDIIDPILSELITHPRALQKAIESDIARLVCGLCPSITAWAHAPKLRTVAEFLVWIVLWDDGIDSPGEGGEFDAEEYVRRSKEYVRWCLLRQHERLNAVREEAAVEPPTKVCELMERVGCGLMDQHGWVEAERNRLWEGLGRYMDACLVEYKVRVSRSDEVPTIDEFWKWRTGTSGVEAFCVMGRVMTAGCWLPDEFVEKSEELRYMGACVNRAFVMVNELFSLKKELKDGACMNLVPLKMHNYKYDLTAAALSIRNSYSEEAHSFQRYARCFRESAAQKYGDKKVYDVKIVDMVEKTVEAHEAIVTGILDFSIHSPRYGIKEYQKEDGSFEIPLQ